MTTALQIVDEDDTSTVLFDCNDPTGVNNAAWGGVQTFLSHNPNWGAARLDRTTFEGDADGGLVPFTRYGLVESTVPIRMKATSYDNLIAGVGRLSFLVGQGTTWLWLPDGASTAKFVDILPSQAPALLDGRELALWDVIHNFTMPDGVPLQLTRQPFFYEAELDPETNRLDNSTLLIDQNNDGRPQGWSWESTTNITGEQVLDDWFQFDVATASARNFRQTILEAVPGDVWSFSFYAKSTSGSSKARAVLEYLDGGGTLLGSEYAGTLTTLTAAPQRLTVTTSTAPGSTTQVRATMRVDNDDATLRHILWRFAQLEEAGVVSPYRVGEEQVSNDPTAPSTPGRVIPFYNAGSAPVPVRMQIEGETGSEITQAYVAVKSNRGLADGADHLEEYLNRRKAIELSTATMGVDATTTADADTASGSAVSVSFATAGVVRRVRASVGSFVDTMVGEYEVFCRCEPQGAATYTLQLVWSPSLADPPWIALAPITLDASTITATDWVEVSLGRIQVPEKVPISSLAFELWAGRTSGASALRLDTLCFAPADESVGIITLPSDSSEVAWDSSSFVVASTGITAVGGDPAFTSSSLQGTPPTTYGARLDAVNEVMGIPTSSSTQGGITLPAGTATWTFHFERWTSSPSHTHTLVMRVVDTGPTGTDAVAATKTVTTSSSISGKFTASLTHTTTGAESYQAQAYLSAFTQGNVIITRIELTFVPYLAVNERFATDPEDLTVHKLDPNDTLVVPVRQAGQTPFWAWPGLSMVYMHFADLPVNGLNESQTTLGRAPFVRFYHHPRSYL